MAGVRQTKQRKGQKHPSWRFWYRDWEGRRRWGTGTRSKSETLSLARKLEETHRLIRLGYLPPPAPEQPDAPYERVVKEYLAWGEAQGGRRGHPWGRTHAASRRRHLPWWGAKLGLSTIGDLKGSLPRAEEALRGLHQDGRSPKTVNAYAESIAALCDWAVARGYLCEDPLKGLKRFSAAPLTRRRALTPGEIEKLLQAVPDERRLLYGTALATGLRARELASLRVRDLDVNGRGLRLDAAWTKNRRPGFQPLPGALAAQLAIACTHRAQDEPLLRVPSHTARTLDADLEAAGIPKATDEGKVDFHAFRTTYATLLIETGANPKEAQTLLRHATPELTMNAYARSRPEGLRRATDRVGELVPLGVECAAGVQRAAAGAGGDTPAPFDANGLGGDRGGGGARFDSRRLHHFFMLALGI